MSMYLDVIARLDRTRKDSLKSAILNCEKLLVMSRSRVSGRLSFVTRDWGYPEYHSNLEIT
ncbi:conserved hypothetical protein [Culex quinquefasciatus]|uniref:Uncharacterized protein n=1 Tax=Culex quinquefasciatus TaxID=7176 RepID=B0WH87_CULQU|nr:conserved hypothetical protein [Culex quinquefasciatus]|eukprot:XP_001848052.1 conserved hypothetical protein [Culex quinquefasciatus]